MPPIAVSSDGPRFRGAILQAILSTFLATLLVTSFLLATTDYASAAKEGKKNKDEKGATNQEEKEHNSGKTSKNEGNAGATQGARQPTPHIPKKVVRTIDDPFSITDNIVKASANFGRSLSDKVQLQEADQRLSIDKTLAPVDMGLEVRIIDQIRATGIANVPAIPRIIVTSAPVLQATEDQGANITFDSTATGTYSIAIVSNEGIAGAEQTISGDLRLGANSALWQAKNQQGELLPSGQYSYYITAWNGAGVRTPPSEGDGHIIIVASPAQAGLSMPSAIGMNGLVMLLAIAIAGSSAALVIYWRKKGSITLYLPVEALPVIEEIRQRYPDATVEENYIDMTKDEGVKRYFGVKIRKSKGASDESNDDEVWLAEIVDKAKKLADVETVNLRYHGKIRVL